MNILVRIIAVITPTQIRKTIKPFDNFGNFMMKRFGD
jgi:hypothetical protein